MTHLNLRSYYKNVTNLLLLLHTIGLHFDVIVLTEVQLFNDTPQVTATGLQLTFDRDKRDYIILAIYRSSSLNCNWFLIDLHRYYILLQEDITYFLVGDINIDIFLSGPVNNNALTYLKDTSILCVSLDSWNASIYQLERAFYSTGSCIDYVFI